MALGAVFRIQEGLQGVVSNLAIREGLNTCIFAYKASHTVHNKDDGTLGLLYSQPCNIKKNIICERVRKTVPSFARIRSKSTHKFFACRWTVFVDTISKGFALVTSAPYPKVAMRVFGMVSGRKSGQKELRPLFVHVQVVSRFPVSPCINMILVDNPVVNNYLGIGCRSIGSCHSLRGCLLMLMKDAQTILVPSQRSTRIVSERKHQFGWLYARNWGRHGPSCLGGAWRHGHGCLGPASRLFTPKP
jgi:hypothetical protein